MGEHKLKSRSNMRRMRREKGWTIKNLADKTGIKTSYLIALERGEEEQQPTAELWFKIATALETTIADILDLPKRVISEQVFPKALQAMEAIAEKKSKLASERFNEIFGSEN